MASRELAGAAPGARTLVVDGVRLAFDDEGEGPALVCVHALAHGARDFEGLRRHFAPKYRVLALDWPGHGRSERDRIATSQERYAELLAGVLDLAGIERCVLLGNSIGGGAALITASRLPERVRGLVLIDSSGLLPYLPFAKPFMELTARFFEAGGRGARWFPWLFERYYRLVLSLPPSHAQRARIVAAAPELAQIGAEAWRSFGRREQDVRALAAGLRIPVFGVWAERDRVNPYFANKPALAKIPGARLATYPGGHSPFLECPDRFFPDLERFLEEVWKSA